MKGNTIWIWAICAVMTILYSCKEGRKENRLSNASSPYLQEHADNPVDWYEWGDEALQKAKAENKPLLISVGYASCHWCHVMEKESFMDTAVARIMNENFINIKVDREERPDIDNIYMNACQLITGGSGGWPLNAFALPDGKPFHAGTYYTKGSWTSLLKQVADAFRNKNNIVIQQAEALTKGIAEQELTFLNKESEPLAIKSQYSHAFDSLCRDIDTVNGGLKGAPKFPMPAVSEFLLQYHYLTGDPRAAKVVHTTLRSMALGGVYDHVNGGFARYSTDTIWRVPHFEKMLYDNGQLLSLYSHAFQVRDYIWYEKLINEIDGFVTRDLTSAEGGFYSSLNADTEKGEGDYYTWTADEFAKAFLSPDERNTAAAYFNVTQAGNWEKGKNILYATMDPIEFGIKKGWKGQQSLDMIEEYSAKLRKASIKSPKPSVDTKILTSWNAIMMIGYIDAYTAIGNEEFLKKAIKNASFLQKNMLRGDGHLWRNFKDGKASIDGFLDDYAWLGKAYLRLYQVTFDKQWLMLADKIARYSMQHFYDPTSKMFFYTAANSSNLVVRKMEIIDNAIPSSNATIAELLHKLGVYLESQNYNDVAVGMWQKIAGKIARSASYYAQWCYIAGLLSYGTSEVAIMGKDAINKNRELQNNYLPDCLFMGETDEENLSLLENKLPDNQTLIYVCTNRMCKLPVEEAGKALGQIKAIKNSRMQGL